MGESVYLLWFGDTVCVCMCGFFWGGRIAHCHTACSTASCWQVLLCSLNSDQECNGGCVERSALIHWSTHMSVFVNSCGWRRTLSAWCRPVCAVFYEVKWMCLNVLSLNIWKSVSTLFMNDITPKIDLSVTCKLIVCQQWEKKIESVTYYSFYTYFLAWLVCI